METSQSFQKPDYQAAKQLAWEVLEANMIVKPPIIAANLAKSYGLQVSCGRFKPGYEHIAGFIDTDENSIVVNTMDSVQRQNFTIAHELGHYLLKHHEQDGYTFLLRDTTSMIKTPMEQEANCFAANVLVPDMFLREYLNQYPGIADERLARLFGVSADVIRFRRLYKR